MSERERGAWCIPQRFAAGMRAHWVPRAEWGAIMGRAICGKQALRGASVWLPFGDPEWADTCEPCGEILREMRHDDERHEDALLDDDAQDLASEQAGMPVPRGYPPLGVVGQPLADLMAQQLAHDLDLELTEAGRTRVRARYYNRRWR